MSLAADFDRATLSVLLDIRHPLAYLALHPAIDFAEAQGIRINWLPLTAQTLNAPSAPTEGDDRGVRHRRNRAHAIGREIETYAAAQGLEVREPYRDGGAAAANLGWLWVRDRAVGKLQAFLSELFRAYWCCEIDPADPKQIATVVDTLGAGGSAFLDWTASEGPRAAEALAGELREKGLFQVPAYVIEEEVFYGRQHLPMIQWILQGRTGRVPI